MAVSWRWLKLQQRAVRYACRHLYRDAGGDARDCRLVAGAGRSGTTWVAGVYRARVPCRIMFEPFHSRYVDEFSAYPYFHYQRPGDDDPGLEAFARRVFEGRIRHPWIDKQVDHVFPRGRLVKAIRANLFLRWIHDRFPEVPAVFVVRHPCAVVLSRMALRWATDGDIEPLLEQPALVEDFLAPHMDVIEGARTPEEKHAVVWCTQNLVPLAQMPGAWKERGLFFYEDLCAHPSREVPRLLAALGNSSGAPPLRAVARPSVTSRGDSAVVTGEDRIRRWQRRLDGDQVRRILSVVERFGLDHLYGASVTPLSRAG